MVATDIFGRGIDIDHVNIVVNYDMPDESDTYLHRVFFYYRIKCLTKVGRAGRFGTKGLAISFISSEDDKAQLEKIQTRFDARIGDLPESIDVSVYSTNCCDLKYFCSEQLKHGRRLKLKKGGRE